LFTFDPQKQKKNSNKEKPKQKNTTKKKKKRPDAITAAAEGQEGETKTKKNTPLPTHNPPQRPQHHRMKCLVDLPKKKDLTTDQRGTSGSSPSEGEGKAMFDQSPKREVQRKFRLRGPVP